MAKLFVVPKQQIKQPIEPEENERDPFEVISDDEAKNLERALRAISFLLAWVTEIGHEGLQKCADTVRDFRKERQE